MGSRHSDNAVPVPGLSRVSVTRVGRSGETRQAGAGAGHTSAGAAAVNQWAFSHFLCRNDCHQLQAGLGWWGSAGPPCAVELQTNLRKDFTITEKARTIVPFPG